MTEQNNTEIDGVVALLDWITSLYNGLLVFATEDENDGNFYRISKEDYNLVLTGLRDTAENIATQIGEGVVSIEPVSQYDEVTVKQGEDVDGE